MQDTPISWWPIWIVGPINMSCRDNIIINISRQLRSPRSFRIFKIDKMYSKPFPTNKNINIYQ